MRGPDEKQTSLSLTVESGDPYIVEVQQLSTNENSYLLTSSHPLLAFPDPDDGHALAAGDSYLGVVDAPNDVDLFELELNAGDRVRIDVDAIGIDAWVGLYYESDSFEEIVYDDDSGGGLFGENSRLVYEAPRGRHLSSRCRGFLGRRWWQLFHHSHRPNRGRPADRTGCKPAGAAKFIWKDDLVRKRQVRL